MTPSDTRRTQDDVLVVANILVTFRARKARIQSPFPWARIFKHIAINYQFSLEVKRTCGFGCTKSTRAQVTFGSRVDNKIRIDLELSRRRQRNLKHIELGEFLFTKLSEKQRIRSTGNQWKVLHRFLREQ